MKITDIVPVVVGNPWKNWIFVRVITDEGIEGLGESTGGLSTKSIVGMLEELRSRIIGRDPTNIQELLDFVRKTLFLGRGESALSGIEMACWDIVGKQCGQPLYKLLGGKVRDSIRVYGNGWYQGKRAPEFFAERAAEMARSGYTALKFDPFGKAYKFMSRKEEMLSMAIVAAVREAVGEDVDLLIECHDRFNMTEAIRMAGLLEPYNPYWYETPVMSDNYEAVAEVARRVNIPVIAGERSRDPRHIAKLLSTGAIDLVNPEILGVGGVLGLLDCFAIARGFDAYVAPHNAQSPYCTAVNVHIGVTQPNLLIQECFDDSIVEGLEEVLTGYPLVKDGFIAPTDAPGIGVELNLEAAARFPYGDKNFLWMFEDEWEMRRGNK
ncbi:MAG: mandelate racemase/muconate lactonizing enzyme family protein [Oscillospiraceae bacterium]|nr:mandelate racemase/muconate lactonizing enzyme family protein [Oscillospiraceae bacterium]